MYDGFTELLTEATICVGKQEYLDELIKQYSDFGLIVEKFSGFGDQFLFLYSDPFSNKPINFGELRQGVSYEQVRYITPVVQKDGVRKRLKGEVGVEFKKDLSDQELDDFMSSNNLILKRKGQCTYLFYVSEGDGMKSFEVVEKLKKNELVEEVNPNFLTYVRRPDMRKTD